MAPKSIPSKCLAHHGPMLYEAKILKVYDPESKSIYVRDKHTEKPVVQTTTSKSSQIPTDLEDSKLFYIHYKGWKSTWDEWIPEDRVLSYTKANLAKSQSIAASLSNKNTKSKSKKTKADIERDETPSGRPEVRLTMPEELKSLIVDDWEQITKNNKLLLLPRPASVSKIIEAYGKQRDSKHVSDLFSGSAEEDVYIEVVNGIKLYFERSLPTILLYSQEREQYDKIKKTITIRKLLCDVYGAEHLIRLFASLPMLIAQTNMDQQSVHVLREYLEDIMTYIADNKDELFLNEYEDI